MCERYSRESGAEQIKTSQPPVLELPVFFACDRKLIGSKENNKLGRMIAPLHLGSATVRVPDETKWNSATDSSKLQPQFKQMGWQIDQKDPTIEPYIELRGYVAEADRQAVLRNVHDDNNFWDELAKDSEEQHGKHRVYVYIPGFGSSGDNSLYAAGVLSSQLEAPVVAFSWPSTGNIGSIIKPIGKHSTRTLYKQDRKTIDSTQVIDDLSLFLSNLKTKLPSNTEVDLVAHSLGNRLLTKYLQSDRSETFDSIYFLAPDVDKKIFLRAAPYISKRADHVEVFTNPHDNVLAASGLLNILELHSPLKAGRAKMAAEGIDFVNYSKIAQPARANHYIPFDKFGALVRRERLMTADASVPTFYANSNAKLEAAQIRQ